MHRRLAVILVVILVYGAVLSVLGQTPSSKYQPGTITAVKVHRSPGQGDADETQYDVSVKVVNTLYVVLYTPPGGANSVRFAAGIERLVLVGNKTLTFNDPVSGATEAPILSRTTVPAETLDWTKVCGQYFSLKMQRLTEILTLTDNQQTLIKPILEQEAGEVDEICFNPVLSRNDTLSHYEKILQASDTKIKPILTSAQLQKLQDLRKGQKQDLKRIISQLKSNNPS